MAESPNEIKPEKPLEYEIPSAKEKSPKEAEKEVPEEVSPSPKERERKKILDKATRAAATAKKAETVVKDVKKIRWLISLLGAAGGCSPACCLIGIIIIVLIVIITIPDKLSKEITEALAKVIEFFSGLLS